MRVFLALLVLAVILLGCSKPQEAVPAKPAMAESQKEDEYKKELEEVKKTLKGDIRIKLKKDGKGDFYSWEIDGKDVAEVLKANDMLVKKLEGQPAGPSPASAR